MSKNDQKLTTASIFIGAVDMFEHRLGESSEITVLKTGKWTHPASGEFEVTEETLESMVQNFAKFGDTGRPEPAVDIDHSQGEALGWFKELKKVGNKLLARIEWNDLGEQTLKNKRYRYFSPEFSVNYKEAETGEVFGPAILGGALTNRPFLRSLGEVTLSENGEELTNNTYILMPKEAEAKKAEETSSVVALSEFKKIQEENLKLKEAQEQATKELNEIKLNARKQDADNFADSLMFNEETGKGRILPKHKDKVVEFMMSLEEGKVAEFKEMLGELKEVETAMFDEGGSAKSDDKATIEVPENVDRESYLLNERAKELMEENDSLNIEQALLLAEKEQA